MTRFQTILARLCASGGRTMMHIDSPAGPGIRDILGAERAEMLDDAIGADNVAVLGDDQEIQVIVPGTAPEAEASGHIRMMRAIKALLDVEGSGITLVTGSGKVSTWRHGEAPGVEALDAELVADALAHRAANAAKA